MEDSHLVFVPFGSMVDRATRGATRAAWPPALSAKFLRQMWGSARNIGQDVICGLTR